MNSSLLEYLLLESNVKGRNQSLCKPEREDQLGTSHKQLGDKSLKESSSTLVLGHVGENSETTLGVLEVAVLDTGLDDIERSGDDERGRGTGNGSNKVLEPASLVVILEVEKVLLGEGRTTEQLNCVSFLIPLIS
jgi:hypothetical protein